MTGKNPPSWFDKVGGGKKDDATAARQRNDFMKQFPLLLARQKDRGRANSFYPYLLIRSVLGDRGDRAINVPFWESPDIWTAPGAPANAPAVPPTHGGTLTAGQPHTLYAHVWNLGFAPIAGVRLEFYWFNPSLAIDGTHAHQIGVARVDLGGRGSPASHKLVKCPQPWIPVMENGGHECLVVRASSIGDPVGNNPWQPWLNRHVAQRNVSVVVAGAGMSNLMRSLNNTHPIGAHLQLIQLGPREGALAAELVAPRLHVAPTISTKLLGELSADGRIGVAPRAERSAGMRAAVHEMARGMTVPPPPPAAPMAAVIHPHALLGEINRTPAGGTARRAQVGDLFGAIEHLNPAQGGLRRPAAGEAYVLRLATFQVQQLIGGYTLVVGGDA
jgi:hypothetical protein